MIGEAGVKGPKGIIGDTGPPGERGERGDNVRIYINQQVASYPDSSAGEEPGYEANQRAK